MYNQKILKDILVQSRSGKKYIVWENNRKTWIIPMDHLRNGFAMYQPTTVKGKIFKLFFLLAGKNLVFRKAGSERIRLEFVPEIQNAIDQLVEDKEGINTSVYMGDPISWQNEKATIQICQDNKIIAFLKVTNQKKVSQIFQHEAYALDYLRERKIKNLPQLSFEKSDEEFSFLFQKTEKNVGRGVDLKLSKKHLDFLWDVNQATLKEKVYEESEFAYYVEYLKNHMEGFSHEQRSVVRSGIQIVEEKLKENNYVYSFFHGDFTPWNIYFEKGEIHVFDFEYAHYIMPQYMDVFHFITQAAMLGKKAGVGGVMHEYRKNYKKISRYVEQPEFTYICYLIFIMAFYLIRTENATEKYEREYNVWIRVLRNLTQRK